MPNPYVFHAEDMFEKSTVLVPAKKGEKNHDPRKKFLTFLKILFNSS